MQLMLTGTDNTIQQYYVVPLMQVWGLNSQEAMITYNHKTTVTHVRWSPDGKFVESGSEDGELKVWRHMTGGHACS
jgi:WD40 repeat protein